MVQERRTDTKSMSDFEHALKGGAYYGVVMGYPIGSILAYFEARTQYEDLQMPIRRYAVILARTSISFGLSFGWWMYMHNRLNELERFYTEPNGWRDRVSHMWRGACGGMLFAIPFASYLFPSAGSLTSYTLMKAGKIPIVSDKDTFCHERPPSQAPNRAKPFSVLLGLRRSKNDMLTFPPISHTAAKSLEENVEPRLSRAVPFVIFSALVGVYLFPSLRRHALGDTPWDEFTGAGNVNGKSDGKSPNPETKKHE